MVVQLARHKIGVMALLRHERADGGTAAPASLTTVPLPLYFTAIALQAVGMRPVPVRIARKPNGSLTKYPPIKAWQKRASTDLAVIKEMFSSVEGYANAIGVVTGGGLFVLDLDCKNGLNGRAALAALEKENMPLPLDTPRALRTR
jgi:hypothetical protein